MKESKLNKEEKQSELSKYRALVLATLEYYLENNIMQIISAEFDSTEHFKELIIKTEEHYQNGRLTRLKQWFRDLTEMQVETGDLKFNQYLQNKTKYNIDIFKSYYQRVDKVIEKGKITTDNQFYEINMIVNQLSQAELVNNSKIEILNRLLIEYEQRKSITTNKPIA